jgi:hypothetical protein
MLRLTIRCCNLARPRPIAKPPAQLEFGDNYDKPPARSAASDGPFSGVDLGKVTGSDGSYQSSDDPDYDP